jgi:hypothetical protein
MANETNRLEWAYNPFWLGFMTKAAAIKLPKFLPRMPTIPGAKPLITPEMPAEVKRMADSVAKPASKIKPAPEGINYAKMNEIPKVPESQAGTMEYGSFGAKSYKPGKKPPAA